MEQEKPSCTVATPSVVSDATSLSESEDVSVATLAFSTNFDVVTKF